MKAEIFCICDKAHVKEGALTVEGIHSIKRAPFFPCVLPQLILGAYIRFDAEEAGDHALAITITNLGGAIIGQQLGNLTVEMPSGTTKSWIHWAGCIWNVPIASASDYTVTFLIDQKPVASTLLVISQKPPSPTEHGPV